MLIAVLNLIQLSGCSAFPHDTSLPPLNFSGVLSADATQGPAAASFLHLWQDFAGDLKAAPRGEIQFSGTMLAWDPAASGAAIALMTAEVARLRRIWAEYYEIKFHGISDAQHDVDIIHASLRQLRREVQALPQTRVMQIAAAGNWWENQIALHEQLGIVDPAGGAAHARHVFHRYCDAKLWEFAVSPPVFNGVYSKRPVTFGPCESYYSSEGFFAGPSCDEGVWFDCFWREGVFRTHGFHSRYDREKQDLIFAMLRDGHLRGALSSEDRGADARAAILGMKKARKKTFTRYEGDPEEDALRELFVPNRSLSSPGHRSADLATPKALTDSIEDHPRSQTSVNPGLAFFPRAKIDDEAFAAERLAHGAFAALGKRDYLAFASTSDFMWNGHSMTMAWSEWIEAAENHPWLTSIVGVVPAPFWETMREQRTKFVAAKSALQAVTGRQAVIDQNFSEQAARTLAASVQPNVAQAFWPEVNFRFYQDSSANEVTAISLALSRNEQPITGPVRSDPSVCVDGPDLCAWLDSGTGSLRVRLSPRQLAGQGFARRLPAPADVDARTRGFNDIPQQFDADTNLEMILYLGRIGRTPVISGRTLIRRSGSDGIAFEVEGEVSFLRL